MAALQKCWDFEDETVRPVRRPTWSQRREGSRKENGGAIYIFGDSAYPFYPQLHEPLKKSQIITPQQSYFKKLMSTAGTSLGETLKYFSFLDYKKNLIIEAPFDRMYCFCVLLTNAHTCLYQSIIFDFHDFEPPALEQYCI